MALKMTETHQYFTLDEEKAESLVAQAKTGENGELIDYKVSQKDTKDGTYYIVTLKTRFTSLQECKESMN